MRSLLALAFIVHSCNGIEGRKRIQKMIYLLQQMGAPFRQEYRFHYYGVYSPEVQNDLDQLSSSLGLLREVEVPAGSHRSHRYETTSKYVELSSRLKHKDYEKFLDAANELSRMSPRDLEALSTIVYLKRRGFTEDRLLDRFKQLKPTLEEEYAKTIDRSGAFVP